MRTFMNRVEYNSVGNEVRLTKVRNSESEMIEDFETAEA